MSRTSAISPSDLLAVTVLQTDPVFARPAHNSTVLAGLLDAVGLNDPLPHLVVTPELALHGYPAAGESTPHGLHADSPLLADLARADTTVVVGFAERHQERTYNSAALLGGDSLTVQRKLTLPTYGQWREGDFFDPGTELVVDQVGGVRFCTLICNDAWEPVVPWRAVLAGAEVLVIIANSAAVRAPASIRDTWDVIVRHCAQVLQTYVVFVNRVGERHGVRFWGGSRIVDPWGRDVVLLGSEPDRATTFLDIRGLRRLRRVWPTIIEPHFDVVGGRGEDRGV